MRSLILIGSAVALALLAADINVFGKPAGAAPPSPDDMVWTNGTYSLQLTGHPCPVPELAAVLEEHGIPPARMFIASQRGQRSSGCWARDIVGDVLALDLAGSTGDLAIPKEWFRRPGV